MHLGHTFHFRFYPSDDCITPAWNEFVQESITCHSSIRVCPRPLPYPVFATVIPFLSYFFRGLRQRLGSIPIELASKQSQCQSFLKLGFRFPHFCFKSLFMRLNVLFHFLLSLEDRLTERLQKSRKLHNCGSPAFPSFGQVRQCGRAKTFLHGSTPHNVNDRPFTLL